MSNFGVRISQIFFISFEPKMSKINLSCKIIGHLDEILRSRLMFFSLPMFNKFFHALRIKNILTKNEIFLRSFINMFTKNFCSEEKKNPFKRLFRTTMFITHHPYSTSFHTLSISHSFLSDLTPATT